MSPEARVWVGKSGCPPPVATAGLVPPSRSQAPPKRPGRTPTNAAPVACSRHSVVGPGVEGEREADAEVGQVEHVGGDPCRARPPGREPLVEHEARLDERPRATDVPLAGGADAPGREDLGKDAPKAQC